MALVTEDLNKFIHTYSDAGMMIKQLDTGILYSDAMDLKEYAHEYEETDEPIETDEPAEDAPVDDAETVEGA